MALQSTKDSFQLKEVSLGDVVSLTNDCNSVCESRTERVVENRSRAPRGWERVFYNVAADRRNEDMRVCLEKCLLVHRSCPDAEKLKDAEKRFEEASAQEKTAASKRGGWFSGWKREKKTSEEAPVVPESHANSAYASFSLMQISRCEHAVEDFSTELFTLAHKPSKVSFERTDATTGEVKSSEQSTMTPMGGKGAPPSSDPPSEVHRKVLQGAKAAGSSNPGAVMDDIILQRWSTARKGKLALEEQGYLRSDEEIRKMKEKDYHPPAAPDGPSGTTPKW